VVVGGVAVVLHGHARLTADLDLAVDLSPVAAAKAIETLIGLGLRPRAPVEPSGFADPVTRARWVAEHGMRVFSMWDPANPMRAWTCSSTTRSSSKSFGADHRSSNWGDTSARVASIPDLIRLKRLAGRREDLLDIEALEAIEERREADDG
jgi:hypothetical protein